jgi:hypothetical protein
MNCTHQWSEQRKRVTPPKYANFEIRFNRCSECGVTQATPEQRQKNNKQANHAYNKYRGGVAGLWGPH